MAKIINGSAIYLALADYLATNAYLNDTAQDVLTMVAKWIDEAPEISVPKWIPVTERLPDKMVQCVCRYVFGENTDYPFFQVLWYFSNLENPHFQHEGSMGLTVTHWIPILEPPEED